MADIPGMAAAHAVITPTCVANRGVAGSIDEALRRARRELERCLPAWQGARTANLHVAVTVEPLNEGAEHD